MTDFAGMSLRDFVAAAASGEPVPGGGGIAACVGALGAAMASMAANFTAGKPKFAEHDAAMRATLSALEPLMKNLLASVDGDAVAFSGISAAYKMPKADDKEKAARKTGIAMALAEAMRVPSRMLEDCLAAAELLPELAAKGNPNLLSDVVVAAIMLRAAGEAALVNVQVNYKALGTPYASEVEIKCKDDLWRIEELAEKTKRIVASRTETAQ